MRWIVEWSLKFRLLALALALLIISIGFIQLRNMPVDTLPEFAPPYIEVQTEAPGLSNTEVEELVTLNLEELLNGTPWLESIRSSSIQGLSSIILTFYPGTDILRARQLVNERLSLAYTLPNVAQAPIILQPLSALSRVMMVGLSSKTISPIQMSVLARWNIRPALLSVPGVANVAIWGMRDQQLQVLVDPTRLEAKHISLDKIISTTGNALWVSPLSFLNASTPGSGGWIETPQQRIEVRHVLPISTPKDLAQVNVEDTNLPLGDVANLVEDHQPLIGDDIVDNGPGLLLVISKFPGSNTLEVTRGIEEKLAMLAPGLSGIQITTLFRPASFVDMQIYHLGMMFLIGFLLLTVVLFVLMHHFRAVLISLISIMTALFAAVLVLNWQGATMNILILSGLVLSLVILIDQAIIDVQNIFQHVLLRRDHHKNEQATEWVNILRVSAFEYHSAIIYATLIILLTLLPFFFLSGVSGSFIRPLATSYAIAILASIVTALFITPALCYLFLSPNQFVKRGLSPVTKWLQNGFSKINEMIISFSAPLLTIGAIVGSLIALAGLTWLFLQERPLIPAFKEPDVIIALEGLPGMSSTEMKRITSLVNNELRNIPGVLNVAATIGRAVLGDLLVDVNSAEITVTIDPSANDEQLLAAIQKVVGGYPGFVSSVQTYIRSEVKQVLTGSSSDIVVRIYGPDFPGLHHKAEEIKSLIAKKIHGATHIHLDEEIKQPQLAIEVDLLKAMHYGLKPGDVRREASTYLAGIEVGGLFQDQKIFPVVVWGAPSIRRNLTNISNLLIDTPSGKWVPLKDVADISIKPIPNLIQHDAVSRYIDIKLNAKGHKVSDLVSQIKEALKGVSFPLEYRAEVHGTYQTQNLNQSFALLFVAVLLVFLLLQGATNSFSFAIVLLFTLPSSLLGGTIVALLNENISMPSLLGVLAVYGITVREALLAISHYQHLELKHKEPFGRQLILRGANDRFIPIITTTLAAFFTLLPFAISGNVSGLEIISPMCQIILGGLITSTLFSLLVIPSLYFWLGKNSVTHLSHDQDEKIEEESKKPITVSEQEAFDLDTKPIEDQ